ncbi:MAG: hypothetical protein V4570_05905 [Pseudomonadota bacterium]
MKLKLFLMLLTAFIFVGEVNAIDIVIDDALSVKNTEAARTSAFVDSEDAISWPALPNESLNDIARAFYPKSSVMRNLFIAKTLRLNTHIAPKINPAKNFEEPVLLIIPTLKSLSKSRQAINVANRAKVNSEKPSIGDSIDKTVDSKTSSNLPALVLQEYELVLSKNTFLKAELARLQEKIAVLQTKLNNLKQLIEASLSLPSNQTVVHDSANLASTNNTKPEAQKIDANYASKKVFKNLDENATNSVKTLAKQLKPLSPTSDVLAPAPIDESSSVISQYVLFAILALLALLGLIAYFLKKYRQRMLTRFRKSLPIMDDTFTEFSMHWQDTDQKTESQIEQQPKAAILNVMSTESRADQAEATSTLEEARLLMNISRTDDAIAHLKLTIENQPKNSINHWLYLLDIYRKLDLKQDFEAYAKDLHRTFNVITPVWQKADAGISGEAIVVPQYLEEFPHIIDKLDALWPSGLAKVYLESLITDNRDGERTGFSREVLDEILLLIAILDIRKQHD